MTNRENTFSFSQIENAKHELNNYVGEADIELTKSCSSCNDEKYKAPTGLRLIDNLLDSIFEHALNDSTTFINVNKKERIKEFEALYLSDFTEDEKRALEYATREFETLSELEMATNGKLEQAILKSIELLVRLPEDQRNLYWMVYHDVDFFDCWHQGTDAWRDFRRKGEDWREEIFQAGVKRYRNRA